MAVLFNNFSHNNGDQWPGPTLTAGLPPQNPFGQSTTKGPGHAIPPPTSTPGFPPQSPFNLQSIFNQSSHPKDAIGPGHEIPPPTSTPGWPQVSFGQAPDCWKFMERTSQSSQPLGKHQPSTFPPQATFHDCWKFSERQSSPLVQPHPFTFPRTTQDDSKKACHEDRCLIVKSIYNLTKVYGKLGGEGFDADLLQLLESSIFELTESLSETCNASTGMRGVAKAPRCATHLFGSAPEKVEVQHSGALQKALEGVKQQQQIEAEKALEGLKQQQKEAEKDLQAVKQQHLEARKSLEETEQQLEGVREQRSDADKCLVSLKKQSLTSENLLEALKQEEQSLREERCQVEKSLKSLKQKHSEADKSLQALVKACEFLERQHGCSRSSRELLGEEAAGQNDPKS